MWLHFFIDCSHVLIFYHSFQSSLLTILGLSDACGQIPTEVRMFICSTQDILYIQEEFIAICLERVALEDPTGVVNQGFPRCQEKFLLLSFTLK